MFVQFLAGLDGVKTFPHYGTPIRPTVALDNYGKLGSNHKLHA